MEARNQELTRRALDAWRDVPRLHLLGLQAPARLPIFSFQIGNGQGGCVHQQLITRMLSDRFGIQARGGCACAGPYVHHLLEIDDEASAAIRQAILSGDELLKPGFIRLNLSVLLSDDKVQKILDAVMQIAADATHYERDYTVDAHRAIFSPKVIAPIA